MPKYTFTVCIARVYFTSSKVFNTDKQASDAMDDYVRITLDNFPSMKIHGFVHLA